MLSPPAWRSVRRCARVSLSWWTAGSNAWAAPSTWRTSSVRATPCWHESAGPSLAPTGWSSSSRARSPAACWRTSTRAWCTTTSGTPGSRGRGCSAASSRWSCRSISKIILSARPPWSRSFSTLPEDSEKRKLFLANRPPYSCVLCDDAFEWWGWGLGSLPLQAFNVNRWKKSCVFCHRKFLAEWPQNDILPDLCDPNHLLSIHHLLLSHWQSNHVLYWKDYTNIILLPTSSTDTH